MSIDNSPIKLGILGAGSFIQRRILPALKDIPSIQVMCLYKQDDQSATKVAAQFGIPYAVSSKKELIDHREVEAVLVATPNHCHEGDAIMCAKAKKPTLCEKPLAPTTDAIIRMQENFTKYNIPLLVGHSLRFKPAILKAKEFLEGGFLGDLYHIRAYFTLQVPATNWRNKKSYGGGVLQDVGVHLIDLIQFLSGENISSIQAISDQNYNRASEKSEVSVTSMGKLTNGAFFSFECSMNQPLQSGFEVIGTKSRLVSKHSLRQTNDSKELFYHILEDDSEVSILLQKNNIYVDELTHFANVIKGKEYSIINSDVGLCNQRIVEAAYESIHKREMILC